MTHQVAVVIPCYRATRSVLELLSHFGPEVTHIYIVDDACPEKSGELVKTKCADPRVKVIIHEENQGVGGAVMTGYRQALLDHADVIVKVDGDGQMNPALIPQFIRPILCGLADYTKGNRFFSLNFLSSMPCLRIFGNAVLSFISKAACGYWNLMDPTNGYTAIHAKVLAMLPLDKLDKRYFFESDMLFRLNTIRAVIIEIPMPAVYGSEKSNLAISQVIREFPAKYLVRFIKRIFYNYFLRDFNMCSLQLLCGLTLFLCGACFGAYHWYLALAQDIVTPIGTVMLAALPVILGSQLLLSAISFDTMNIPREPLHPRIA